jgi:hypothetical protein
MQKKKSLFIYNKILYGFLEKGTKKRVGFYYIIFIFNIEIIIEKMKSIANENSMIYGFDFKTWTVIKPNGGNVFELMYE